MKQSYGVRLFGHNIHPMLIVFPLGLLATSVAFDIIYLITDNGMWSETAFWMIAAGIIGGLGAAVFGLLDWTAIPSGTRAKAIGLFHGLGNALIVLLFAISWFLRYDSRTSPEAIAIVLSWVGAGLALVTAWLGGEMVERLGVAVDVGAHPNAPSSLSGRPATENYRQVPVEGTELPRRETR